MIFSNKVNKKLRAELDNKALLNRAMIDKKLNEAIDVDKQLAKVILETKELTASIQEKLSSRLKITRKTIKNIVTNIREGVVILNNVGDIIETNEAFEKTFLCGSEAVGMNFKIVCAELNPTKEDGSKFMLNVNFAELSQLIFESQNLTNIQPEIIVEVHQAGVEPFKCLFSMSVLDNDPAHVTDVCFISFFKCLRRQVKEERRLSARA